ncbi:MAG: DUF2800 domain-containing protein [Bacteroidales bacterium]|nr:DUF2800 domain-containing protein [Bacteroidales bacterium]
MAKHAVLSASASKQWLNCPPSARLQENFPNESSVYAEEGTFAHEVCEYKVKKYLHERVKRPQSEEFYTEEIDQITVVYADFVIGVIEEMKAAGCQPLVLVEERLDYSHIAPSGFGTGDMVIIGVDEEGKGLLHICDFKTGSGVFVSADHNTQMMLYALGAIHAYGYIYDIQTVRMTIIQPRLENISTFTCTAKELTEWGESIKPVAKMAYEGKGEQHPGDWCRFCRAKPMCKACAEEALALAREEFLDLDEGALEDERISAETETTDATDPYNPDTDAPVFKAPGLVSLSELEEILPTLNRISTWIESVFAYVSGEAINHGVPIRGYKVVEGRSKRQFTDTKAVVQAAAENGFTDVYKQELISLTEFEKLMGKKRFAQILGQYVVKPPGKLALVPESDPRPAVDLNDTASDEFEALD